MAQEVMINEEKSPNIILRFLWFILIGWWLGYIVTSIAFFFEATIIGIPLALYLFHRTPAIMTLKARSSKVAVYRNAQGQLEGQEFRPEQYSLGLRIIYFLFIGWWFTGVWIGIAFALAASIIGVPVAFWMVDQVPLVSSLARV
jgi:uncharacterized membrane protein YccF (DUF307 family)